MAQRNLPYPVLALLLACTDATMAASATSRRDLASREESHRVTTVYTPAQRMRTQVGPVQIEGASAREALDWWSSTARIPVVIHWTQLEAEGLDPESEINIRLHRASAHVVLDLILQQVSEDVDLIVEPTQWYVEVMTKEQALRKSVARVYYIGDLLHHVPDFGDAPAFNLQSALGNTNSGGGRGGGTGRSSGGGTGIFGDSSRDDREREDTEEARADRAESLVRTIRETIEPDIWQAHGGQYASIRYYQRRLIVKAPPFVHRQIGLTGARSDRSGPSARHRRRIPSTPRLSTAPSTRRSTAREGISGIRRTSPRHRVSGISR